jgi:hypothetical protein
VQCWRKIFLFEYPIAAGDEEASMVSVSLWRKVKCGYLIRFDFQMRQEKAFEMRQESTPPFIQHHVTRQNQAELYRIHRAGIQDDEVLLHFDFSENFVCSAQDQIQGAFYGQHKISIFTAVIHSKAIGTKSVVICSDDLDHTKRAVMVFILELFEDFVKSNDVRRVRQTVHVGSLKTNSCMPT